MSVCLYVCLFVCLSVCLSFIVPNPPPHHECRHMSVLRILWCRAMSALVVLCDVHSLRHATVSVRYKHERRIDILE